MIGIIAAIAIVVGLIFAWPLRQRKSIVFGIVLALAALTRDIVYFGTVPTNVHLVNIAGEVPTFTTIDVAIAITLLMSTAGLKDLRPFLWIAPGLFGLFLGLTVLWPVHDYITAGAVHLALTLAAWPVGRYLAGSDLLAVDRERLLARIILTFLLVQLAFCTFQILAQLPDDRAAGTFDHPAHLGKIVVLLLVILLPLTHSSDLGTSRAATLGIAVGAIATASTLSRANIIAVIGALVLWSSLGRRKSANTPALKSRVWVPALAIVVSLPFLDAVVQRFLSDAQGGLRPELFAGGVRVVTRFMWMGTGPNNFAETAATTEPIFAQTGAPIHNTFLLLVGELGIPILVLFILPIIRTITLALRRLRSDQAVVTDTARAVLVTVAMVSFAGSTGWGFLVSPVPQLLYFTIGFADGRLTKVPERDSQSPDPDALIAR